MNDGAVRNVGNVRKIGNVRHVENVRNVLLYTTKYHQISNNNKSKNFQPVADIVLLCLFVLIAGTREFFILVLFVFITFLKFFWTF